MDHPSGRPGLSGVRRAPRLLRTLTVAAAASAAAMMMMMGGCADPTSVGPGVTVVGPASISPVSRRSAPTPSVPVGSRWPSVGLRGVAVTAFSCPRTEPPAYPPGDVTAPVAGEVSDILLCPFPPDPRSPAAPTLLRAGSAGFADVLHQLALPDGPAGPSGSACPAYREVPRTVLLRSAVGIWRAVLPSDRCGDVLSGVLSALDAARSTG